MLVVPGVGDISPANVSCSLSPEHHGDIVCGMTQHINPSNVLLIFDLDGTLYRTESSFVPTIKLAYKEHDIPYPGDAVILKRVGETFPTYLEWLVTQGFPIDVGVLRSEIGQHELDSIRHAGELYPDVEATLRDLKRQGFKLAICTNGDAHYTHAVLGRFDLRGLFDSIQTHDNPQQTKTKMIAVLLEQFRPDHAFMIGDRYHDFVAGHANDCTVVAATYGFAADGEADEVDVRLQQFSDLPAIIARTLGA